MRVTGGEARGRALKAPPGHATRPTSDLVRGAMFSMLAARDADLSRVLDLYAGSGALGIEALSRGAEWCDFVEKDPRAAAIIRENLRALGFGDRAAVHQVAVQRAPERLSGEPYTLALADPPYEDPGAEAAIEAILRSPLVAPSTILVWERSSRKPRPAAIGSFDCIAERGHGDTVILLFAQVSSEETPA
jgi:16S rRNA (guanine966-N2)-methyltransferase